MRQSRKRLFGHFEAGDSQSIVAGGVFRLERWDGDQLLQTMRFHNGIPTAALNHIANSTFLGTTQLTAWHIGLIKKNSFSALAATDTMASHAGWLEGTDYDESTRLQWNPATSTAGTLIDAVGATFTLNAAVTYVGLFLSSDNTKGGTSGTLWATGLSDVEVAGAVGQTLKAFYELRIRQG